MDILYDRSKKVWDRLKVEWRSPGPVVALVRLWEPITGQKPMPLVVSSFSVIRRRELALRDLLIMFTAN